LRVFRMNLEELAHTDILITLLWAAGHAETVPKGAVNLLV
jgi:hypothetical protein